MTLFTTGIPGAAYDGQPGSAWLIGPGLVLAEAHSRSCRPAEVYLTTSTASTLIHQLLVSLPPAVPIQEISHAEMTVLCNGRRSGDVIAKLGKPRTTKSRTATKIPSICAN